MDDEVELCTLGTAVIDQPQVGGTRVVDGRPMLVTRREFIFDPPAYVYYGVPLQED